MKDGLAKSVISEEEEHRMAGVLPASMIMTRRLQALGYVVGKVVGENPVVATGKTIRGHEFRCSWMDCARDARSRTGSPCGPGRQGRMVRNAPGGYLHTHVYSYPMDWFVDGCREYGGGGGHREGVIYSLCRDCGSKRRRIGASVKGAVGGRQGSCARVREEYEEEANVPTTPHSH